MYLDDFGQPVGSAGQIVAVTGTTEIWVEWTDDGSRTVSRPPGYGVSIVWAEEYEKERSRYARRPATPVV